MKLFTSNIKFTDYNFKLIINTIIVSIFGIIVLGSVDKYYLRQQLIGVLIGIFAMLFFSRIDYREILSYYRIIYLFNIILLLIVTFFGTEVNDARRWLNIGFITFQPSELSKILLILFFTGFLFINKEKLNNLKTLSITSILAAIPLFLILKEPDLSTTIILLFIIYIIVVISGLSRKYFYISIIALVALIAIFFIIIKIPNQKVIPKYQQNRVLAWLNPEKYEANNSMQQQNSIQAIGSGQLTGKGLYNDNYLTYKNSNYVPESQTDFIFTVVGEETGFIGSFLVVFSLYSIVILCFVVGYKSIYTRGRIIATGIGTWIGIQSFVNIAVTTGLFPNTGVTLPFISYGLTSVVSLYIGIGIILNIDIQTKIQKRMDLIDEKKYF